MGTEQGQLVLFSGTCTSVVNEVVVPVLCACGCAISFLYSCTVVLADVDAVHDNIYTPHLLNCKDDVPVSSTVLPFFSATELSGTAVNAVTTASNEFVI